MILVGVCVLLYPQVASWFSQKEQSRVTELAQESMDEPPNNDAEVRAAQIAQAHEYNDALASGALLNANANVAVGDGIFETCKVVDEVLDAEDVTVTVGVPVGGVVPLEERNHRKPRIPTPTTATAARSGASVRRVGFDSVVAKLLLSSSNGGVGGVRDWSKLMVCASCGDACAALEAR